MTKRERMRILSVVGARPNFMKIAPFIHELNRYPDEFVHCLVHTGQHYDWEMSKSFFEELDIPQASVDLGNGARKLNEATACNARQCIVI